MRASPPCHSPYNLPNATLYPGKDLRICPHALAVIRHCQKQITLTTCTAIHHTVCRMCIAERYRPSRVNRTSKQCILGLLLYGEIRGEATLRASGFTLFTGLSLPPLPFLPPLLFSSLPFPFPSPRLRYTPISPPSP